MNTKLIIFDLDGTLIDSIEGLKVGMNNVLDSNELPIRSLEDYKEYAGDGLMMLVKRALPEQYQDDNSVQYFYQEMLKSYQERYMVGLSLYPGIENMLDVLTEKGLLLAINTNKNQDMTDHIIDSFLSKWDFKNVVGIRPDVLPKPNPSTAKNIADKLGVHYSECLFVGDTPIDYYTAENAGMRSALVTWGFRPYEELKRLNKAVMIHSPCDLLKHI